MQQYLPAWLSSLERWRPVLPSLCLACHAWPCQQVLCHDCWQRFAPTAMRCSGCALALPGINAQRPQCGHCLQNPGPWSKAHAWTDYGYPWSNLIGYWKFGQQPALARHFAHWMLQDPHISAMVHAADVLLPIPMSSRRMRERGYNPAAQLAQRLSADKCQPYTLVRQQHTTAQSGLTRQQRLRNLHNALTIAPEHQHRLIGKKVLLIDDVMTTGATFAAATQCILQAGAAEVQVLCMARTP